MTGIATVRHTDWIAGFISTNSDGRIGKIEIDDEDRVLCLYDNDGFPAAIGWLRGFKAGWDHKCLGLVVKKDCRRRGYGKLLMHCIEVLGRDMGLDTIRLHVSPDNTAAYDLYKSLGYQLEGQRDDGELICLKRI